MKRKTLILISLFYSLTFNAQIKVIDINDRDTELTNGTYIKDIYNQLDKFEGTWVYKNGNTSLTITFQKKIRVVSPNFYRDLLIGEYKYIENGIEKINTLPNLDNQNNLKSLYDHNLTGSLILLKYEFPGCPKCDIKERRVKVYFDDDSIGLEHLVGTMAMGLRYIDDVTPKMEINFAIRGAIILPDGAPQEPNLPFGHYLLTKQ